MADRNPSWRHYYYKALTETDPEKLHESVAQAEEVISQRLVAQGGSEKEALQSALCHVRLIQSIAVCFVTECV